MVEAKLINSSILNKAFESEVSAYRFIDNILVQIDNNQEIISLENAIQTLDPTSPSREHIQRALALLSDRKNPDYRNSVKESISAVESTLKSLLKDDKVTMGQALNRLEKEHSLHPALKSSFAKLYGYTSDSGGIRHALSKDDAPVDAEEARFMLVTCSAFVNYLISRLG